MKLILISLMACGGVALVGCNGSDKSGDSGGSVNAADMDGDGFASISAGGSDCDDDNAAVYPGAEEDLTDGLDNDCDDAIDEGGGGGGTDPECGGAAPVLESFDAQAYEYSGQHYVYFAMTMSDADGDLHDLHFDAWWDDSINGSVDTSVDANLVYDGSNLGSECNTGYYELGLVTPSRYVGDTLAWETAYEFAVQITDANGDLSNVLVSDMVTPPDPDATTGDSGTGDSGTGGCDTADTASDCDTGGECDTADTGCDDGGTGTGGDTGDTGDTGSDALSFAADIQPILNKNCTPCHIGGSSSGGMALDAPAYKNIVSVASNQVPGMNRIEPGDTTNSYLFLKLAGIHKTAGGTGDQMPPTGALAPADLSQINTWISEGAAP